MSDRQKSIYFIAIIPETSICSEIKAFKTYAQEQFDTSRALRSPAHITLEPPFKWEESDIGTIENSLADFARKQSGFYIELQNFDAFSPRVIFVDVVENPMLMTFQDQLKIHLRETLHFVSDRPERAYHPHMTIAFRDLKKDVFPSAWTYFSEQEYKRTFLVNRICLLQHNGAIWEERSFFDMKQA